MKMSNDSTNAAVEYQHICMLRSFSYIILTFSRLNSIVDNKISLDFTLKGNFFADEIFYNNMRFHKYLLTRRANLQ